VSTGATGHAETVRVSFDPHRITYGRILQIYFSVAHDPTQPRPAGTRQGHAVSLDDLPDQSAPGRDRQGPYRPARRGARVQRRHRHHGRAGPVILSGRGVSPDYLTRHPGSPYIAAYDLPKLEELRRIFPELYRADPILVAAGSLSN
jgi:peptide-methionine (S)-S-oxide reductase